MLDHYEKRAKGLTMAELLHALRDIKSTLAIWRGRPLSDLYVAKLYAELDAYSVETYRRQRNGRTYQQYLNSLKQYRET